MVRLQFRRRMHRIAEAAAGAGQNEFFSEDHQPSDETAVFGFSVLYGLLVFPNLVFGFRFLSTLMAVFRIFLSNADTIFLVSPRTLHPAVAVIPETASV